MKAVVATVDVVVGRQYEFYAEMQEDYRPAEVRMRNYTGQMVTVIEELPPQDEESPTLYKVRAADGRVFDAQVEEINGWDKALGQYFWPDGTFGPDHDTRFLRNEK